MRETARSQNTHDTKKMFARRIADVMEVRGAGAARDGDASKIVKYSGRVYFVAGLFALRNHDISRAVFVRLRS